MPAVSEKDTVTGAVVDVIDAPFFDQDIRRSRLTEIDMFDIAEDEELTGAEIFVYVIALMVVYLLVRILE